MLLEAQFPSTTVILRIGSWGLNVSLSDPELLGSRPGVME